MFYGLGLALIAIAVEGIKYQLFAAPPEEPISGQFADYPMVEALFISGLWALTGIASILMVPVLENAAEGSASQGILKGITYWLLCLAGLTYLLFGALNYFTHIGLILHTMPK